MSASALTPDQRRRIESARQLIFGVLEEISAPPDRPGVESPARLTTVDLTHAAEWLAKAQQ